MDWTGPGNIFREIEQEVWDWNNKITFWFLLYISKWYIIWPATIAGSNIPEVRVFIVKKTFLQIKSQYIVLCYGFTEFLIWDPVGSLPKSRKMSGDLIKRSFVEKSVTFCKSTKKQLVKFWAAALWLAPRFFDNGTKKILVH